MARIAAWRRARRRATGCRAVRGDRHGLGEPAEGQHDAAHGEAIAGVDDKACSHDALEARQIESQRVQFRLHVGEQEVPESSVRAVCAVPRLSLVNVTVTPGRTAACASVTEPAIEALVVCARSGAEEDTSVATRATRRVQLESDGGREVQNRRADGAGIGASVPSPGDRRVGADLITADRMREAECFSVVSGCDTCALLCVIEQSSTAAPRGFRVEAR